MRRGEPDVRAFAEAILERLNDPKNASKGDWRKMARGELLELLLHEVAELTAEIAYTYPEPEDVRREAADVGALAMFIADWTDYHWTGEKLEEAE